MYIYMYIYIQRQLYNYCILYIRTCNVYRGDAGLGCGMSRHDFTYIFDKANSTCVVHVVITFIVWTQGRQVSPVSCQDMITYIHIL